MNAAGNIALGMRQSLGQTRPNHRGDRWLSPHAEFYGCKLILNMIHVSEKIVMNRLIAAAAVLLIGSATPVCSQEGEEAAGQKIKVFDVLVLTVPAEWETQAPKSRIIEREYSLKTEGDAESKTRVTLMAAGGGVDANIKRWEGQFSGGNDAKVEKMSVAGQTVHFIQLDGTYKETMGGGPFSGGKTVMREDYAMLGGIIEMKDGRQYFIKMIGPESEVEPQREAFKQMLMDIKG
jgi:hypothetical protein